MTISSPDNSRADALLRTLPARVRWSVVEFKTGQWRCCIRDPEIGGIPILRVGATATEAAERAMARWREETAGVERMESMATGSAG